MDLSGAVPGLVGGLMIGGAAALLLLGLGRIAGVSGLLARAAGLQAGGAPWTQAAAFLAGLPLGATAATRVLALPVPDLAALPAGQLVVAGLLVGFGTRLGSGCTSGHGVCGLSRLSPRSLVATAVFMTAGILTATALHGRLP